jgi:superfamily II DNA or RNA helicase
VSVQLRDYQEKAVAELRAAMAAGARAPLLVLPTGGGKTTIFAEIVRRAVAKGKRAVVLAHRRELITQAASRLRTFGLNPGLIMPGGTPGDGSVYAASVQTLVRDIGSVPAPDLLIIDEAHHAVAGSWATVREAWASAACLGVTATPVRLDGRGLGDAFDAMVLGPSARELTDRGFLCPVDVFAPSVPDLAGVRSRGGDWTPADLERALARSGVVGDAVRTYGTTFPGGAVPTVVFCASVAHATAVSAAFRAAGYRFEVLTGSDRRDRREGVLAALAAGDVAGICTVDLVSEGFDLPDLRCAVWLRPTKSLGLWLQGTGRVLRPAPGKGRAVVLDHAGNALRHLLPTFPHQWGLDGVRARPRSQTHTEDGEALSIQRCPACFQIHETAPVCPHCGHEHPPDTRVPVERAGELRRLEEEEAARIREAQRAEEKGDKTIEDWLKIARERGYSTKWAHIRHGLRTGRRRAA